MFTITDNREILIQPERPTLDTGPGLTKQSEKDKTDINLIMAKYQKTGMISFGTTQQGEYTDMEAVDFTTAMQTITRANEMFSEMPSSHRKRFKNSPEEFLEFVHNPDNLEEMYELGLADRPTPDPEPITPVEDPTPEA